MNLQGEAGVALTGSAVSLLNAVTSASNALKDLATSSKASFAIFDTNAQTALTSVEKKLAGTATVVAGVNAKIEALNNQAAVKFESFTSQMTAIATKGSADINAIQAKFDAIRVQREGRTAKAIADIQLKAQLEGIRRTADAQRASEVQSQLSSAKVLRIEAAQARSSRDIASAAAKMKEAILLEGAAREAEIRIASEEEAQTQAARTAARLAEIEASKNTELTAAQSKYAADSVKRTAASQKAQTDEIARYQAQQVRITEEAQAKITAVMAAGELKAAQYIAEEGADAEAAKEAQAAIMIEAQAQKTLIQAETGAKLQAIERDNQIKLAAIDADAAAAAQEEVTARNYAQVSAKEAAAKEIQAITLANEEALTAITETGEAQRAAVRAGAANVAAAEEGRILAGGNVRGGNGLQAGYLMEHAGNNLMTAGALAAAPVAGAYIAANGFEMPYLKAINNSDLNTSERTSVRQFMLNQMRANVPVNAEEGFTATRHALDLRQIGQTVPQALEVARAGMMTGVAKQSDIGDTTQAIARVMYQFKLNASDAMRVANSLSAAANNTNMTFEQFAENSGRAMAAASELGVNVNDAAAAFTLLTKEGNTSAQAATSIRSILKSLTAETPKLTKELDRLKSTKGIDLKDLFGEKNLAANGLEKTFVALHDRLAALGEAGRKQELLQLFPDQRSSINTVALATDRLPDLINLIHKEGTAWEANNSIQREYNETVAQAGPQMKIFLNHLTLMGVAFEKNVLPFVIKFMSFLDNIMDDFGKLSPMTKRVITDLLIAVATIGTLGGIALKVAGAFSGLLTVLRSLGGFVTIFKAIGLAATEAGASTAIAFGTASAAFIAVAAIIGLVGGLVYWWNQVTDAENDAAGAMKRYAQMHDHFANENLKTQITTSISDINTQIANDTQDLKAAKALRRNPGLGVASSISGAKIPFTHGLEVGDVLVSPVTARGDGVTWSTGQDNPSPEYLKAADKDQYIAMLQKRIADNKMARSLQQGSLASGNAAGWKSDEWYEQHGLDPKTGKSVMPSGPPSNTGHGSDSNYGDGTKKPAKPRPYYAEPAGQAPIDISALQQENAARGYMNPYEHAMRRRDNQTAMALAGIGSGDMHGQAVVNLADLNNRLQLDKRFIATATANRKAAEAQYKAEEAAVIGYATAHNETLAKIRKIEDSMYGSLNKGAKPTDPKIKAQKDKIDELRRSLVLNGASLSTHEKLMDSDAQAMHRWDAVLEQSSSGLKDHQEAIDRLNDSLAEYANRANAASVASMVSENKGGYFSHDQFVTNLNDKAHSIVNALDAQGVPNASAVTADMDPAQMLAFLGSLPTKTVQVIGAASALREVVTALAAETARFDQSAKQATTGAIDALIGNNALPVTEKIARLKAMLDDMAKSKLGDNYYSGMTPGAQLAGIGVSGNKDDFDTAQRLYDGINRLGKQSTSEAINNALLAAKATRDQLQTQVKYYGMDHDEYKAAMEANTTTLATEYLKQYDSTVDLAGKSQKQIADMVLAQSNAEAALGDKGGGAVLIAMAANFNAASQMQAKWLKQTDADTKEWNKLWKEATQKFVTDLSGGIASAIDGSLKKGESLGKIFQTATHDLIHGALTTLIKHELDTSITAISSRLRRHKIGEKPIENPYAAAAKTYETSAGTYATAVDKFGGWVKAFLDGRSTGPAAGSASAPAHTGSFMSFVGKLSAGNFTDTGVGKALGAASAIASVFSSPVTSSSTMGALIASAAMSPDDKKAGASDASQNRTSSPHMMVGGRNTMADVNAGINAAGDVTQGNYVGAASEAAATGALGAGAAAAVPYVAAAMAVYGILKSLNPDRNEVARTQDPIYSAISGKDYGASTSAGYSDANGMRQLLLNRSNMATLKNVQHNWAAGAIVVNAAADPAATANAVISKINARTAVANFAQGEQA